MLQKQPMLEKKKNNILDKVKNASKIGIVGHVRPDGDCVGSCMSLYLYLKENKPEAKTDVYLEYVPKNLSFIKDTDKVITTEEEDENYDIFFCLDCGDLERTGKFQKYFKSAKHTICIDHHISNTEFADENHVVSDASSTCECLFDWMETEKISLPVAEALYTGIIHDTGVFGHTNTTKKTMETAGALIEKGIPFSKIIDESFYQKTYIQNQILGRCLLESIMILDGKCIISAINEKMLNFYGASPEDLDGIVDQLRITKGVEVAIFIYEMHTKEYKVSMRSNGDVDVSRVAIFFGGGGHVKAAGCTMQGVIYDVINNLTGHIEAQLKAKEGKPSCCTTE